METRKGIKEIAEGNEVHPVKSGMGRRSWPNV